MTTWFRTIADRARRLLPLRRPPLSRHDVVGHRIARVLQTPWQQMDEMVVARFFVLLETGILLELAGDDGPLTAANISISGLNDVDFGGESCNGDVVFEVLDSDYWPGVGLLLSSRRYLHCGADIPFVFQACLSTVGEAYSESDCRPHWPYKR